ncbi:MAG: 4-hydroxythreonine-4-phosphate dehydrogenase [Candidatus Pelagisphaera sp.]|jgi:4-hydroxythreonine-4-phosphate dehydrogenase
MEKPRLAITCGDPAGVGPELINKCLSEMRDDEAHLSLIGPGYWLDEAVKACPFEVEPIVVGLPNAQCEVGKPTGESSKIALEAMERAARGCALGKFDGVATGPISKSRCAEVGFSHPGQTEFFASHWGGSPTMGFVGEKLKVVLATWHIPLATVSYHLTESCLTMAIDRAHDLATRMGCQNPRIGVCGLYPHAGEEGLLGSEEVAIFNPLIAQLRESIPGLSDCQPGDTLFYRALNGEFDVVVALYHDQGLAPLKAIEFDKAVNVTLGLRHTRTSPDHGTGYDIAGTGKASHQSFIRAIRLAIQLSKRSAIV